jgi:two-component system invasion response regulator UvrY
VNILIVDDHAIVRRGIRELLAEAFPSASCIEATSAEDALRILASKTCTAWALIILDIAMPGRGGLDALPQIHADHPETPVLVLSGHAQEQYAIRALRAGAVGYLTKDSATEELVTAAHKALAGGTYVGASLAEQLARDVRNALGRPLHEMLSDREFQVMRMLATGRSVKQIGVDLSLSEKTISTYRARVLAKMAMTSNADLVRYALKIGLVD